MVTKKQQRRVPGRWVYAYELNPPQPEPRFSKIRMLLRRAQATAKRGGRLWTGRIVVESNITHILVVTDDPGQVRHVDRAIETELKRLNMRFALTGPARFALPRVKNGKRAPKRAVASKRRRVA
ncbi:MAG TPA: hypothetical protein VIV10_09210 [Gemmatimonadales bacterium]